MDAVKTSTPQIPDDGSYQGLEIVPVVPQWRCPEPPGLYLWLDFPYSFDLSESAQPVP